jgi:release factor glutamine methyltransferase
VTLHSALLQGTRLLEEANVSAPRLTAEVLLAHAIGRDRVWLHAHSNEQLREVCRIQYGRYLHERLEGKPTQYITRRQEFYGREFRVSPDVLIPRPETEHVVERALAVYEGGRMADAGTGSGAIAITLSLETGTRVVGTDISPKALAVAGDNADRLGAPVDFACCDLVSALAAGSCSLVACNPPYVPENDRGVLQREVVAHEPHVALFGGADGFEIYERLIEDASRVLQPGGWLIMETAYNTHPRLAAMLERRWTGIHLLSDLAGLPRVVSARKRS